MSARATLDHTRFASIVIGLVFVSSAATTLGLVSRNSKTFIVAFLGFWYGAMNSTGASPLLDFAVFFGGGNDADAPHLLRARDGLRNRRGSGAPRTTRAGLASSHSAEIMELTPSALPICLARRNKKTHQAFGVSVRRGSSLG
ncbi:MAG: hypothetical protein M3Y69_03320 [Verrucomicrobiota bacterium]|nr:hypothetical protein [Verrucomicrobiota bacterium]